MDANPTATKAVMGVVIAVFIGVIGYEVFGGRRGITTKAPNSFFSDDDGKTYFVAGADNIPPFDHNGKTAVSAFVYRCEGSDFVGFLSRYTPEARQRIIASKRITPEDERFGRELKKPGDAVWVKGSDVRRVGQIADVKGPKGQTSVEPIEPDM